MLIRGFNKNAGSIIYGNGKKQNKYVSRDKIAIKHGTCEQ